MHITVGLYRCSTVSSILLISFSQTNENLSFKLQHSVFVAVFKIYACSQLYAVLKISTGLQQHIF